MSYGKPLLTICIPTHNRAPMLKNGLELIVPQIQDASGIAELIISDNCSTDDTERIIAEYRDLPWVHSVRNDRNLGPLGNGLRCLTEASGEYVWFIGDDDILRPGALRYVLEAIERNSDIDFFFANATTIDTKKPKWRVDGQVSRRILTSLEPARCKPIIDRRIQDFSELIDYSFDPLFLGAMMCNILRRSLWNEGLRGLRGDELTGTLEGTYPQCSVLAKTMIGKPAYYIGYPCTIALWGHQEWSGWIPYIHLRTFHFVLDEYEAKGIDRHRIRLCRQLLLQSTGLTLARFLLGKRMPGRELFSLRQYLQAYSGYYGFWVGLAKILGEAIEFLIRMFDRSISRLLMK